MAIRLNDRMTKAEKKSIKDALQRVMRRSSRNPPKRQRCFACRRLTNRDKDGRCGACGFHHGL